MVNPISLLASVLDTGTATGTASQTTNALLAAQVVPMAESPAYAGIRAQVETAFSAQDTRTCKLLFVYDRIMPPSVPFAAQTSLTAWHGTTFKGALGVVRDNWTLRPDAQPYESGRTRRARMVGAESIQTRDTGC